MQIKLTQKEEIVIGNVKTQVEYWATKWPEQWHAWPKGALASWQPELNCYAPTKTGVVDMMWRAGYKENEIETRQVNPTPVKVTKGPNGTSVKLRSYIVWNPENIESAIKELIQVEYKSLSFHGIPQRSKANG